MARSRKDLDEALRNCVKNVYYQPPPSLALSYPCIVYKRASTWVNRADDMAYFTRTRYDVTYIAKDVDDDYDYTNNVPKETMRSKILNSFDNISHDRFYTADSLNHDTFTLYY